MYSYRFITRNFFDVFWGEGWDNCVRIKRIKDGSYVIVRAYKKPPKDLLVTIKGDLKHEAI
jgi:hypothetical protein